MGLGEASSGEGEGEAGTGLGEASSGEGEGEAGTGLGEAATGEGDGEAGFGLGDGDGGSSDCSALHPGLDVVNPGLSTACASSRNCIYWTLDICAQQHIVHCSTNHYSCSSLIWSSVRFRSEFCAD